MIRTRSIIYIYIYIRRRERVCTFLSLESCCRVRVVGRKPFRVCQSSNSETRRPGFDFFLLVPKINQLFLSFSGGEYTQSDDGEEEEGCLWRRKIKPPNSNKYDMWNYGCLRSVRLETTNKLKGNGIGCWCSSLFPTVTLNLLGFFSFGLMRV